MAAERHYNTQIRAIDAGVEWFVKGANIGLFFGLFFAPVDVLPGAYYIPRCGLSVVQNMGVTGGVLGSWQFFVKGF